MKARYLAFLLALLLLVGCQAPVSEPLASSPAPDPAPSPTTQVAVHWDALEPREPLTTLAARVSDGPLPELIPSSGYGPIVPYIGGEQRVFYDYGGEEAFYSTHYLYGLCTDQGLILTDPVYLLVYQPSWYDSSTGMSHDLPLWVMTQTAEDETGQPFTAVTVTAADGSWTTGPVYQAGLSAYIAATQTGLLMKLDQDTAVFLGTDGREICRYTPADFLPADVDPIYAQWFFDDGLNWLLRCRGEYLYFNPQELGSQEEPRWMDPKTGQFLSEAPADAPEEHIYDESTVYTDGYLTAVGTDPLTITCDDGATFMLTGLPDGLGALCGVSLDHLLFCSEDNIYTLTDHFGNILYTTTDSENIWFIRDSATGRQWPFVNSYEGDYTWHYRVLDETGRTVVTAQDISTPACGTLALADDTCYRLVDLSTGEDLIRIPRWSAMDLPAND